MAEISNTGYSTDEMARYIHIWYTLTYVFSFGFISQHIWCSVTCGVSLNCTRKNTELDCSHKNLRRVPEDICTPFSIEVMDLSYNEINVLTTRSLEKCTELIALYIQQNGITSIAANAFKSNEKLEILDISFNLLSDSYGSLPYDLFRNQSLLSVLNISKQRTGPSVYRDDLWNGKYSLVSLAIDVPDGQDIPESFKNLRNLFSLSLCGSLTTIRNSTLAALRDLKISRFSVCSTKLQNLSHDAFNSLTNLNYLDLSNNVDIGAMGNNYKNLVQALKNMNKSQLETLVLNSTSSFIVVNEIDRTFWEAIATRSLKHLYLDQNFLVKIDASISKYTPNIETLSFAANKLQGPISNLKNDISKLKHLKLLNVSFQARPRPNILNYDYEIQDVNQVTIPPELEYFYCQGCYDISFPQQHVTYQLQSNQSKVKLKYLDFSRNDMKHLYGNVTINHNTTVSDFTIDVSENGLEDISDNFLRGLASNLVSLNLANNNLQTYVAKNPFIYLTRLQKISLRGNKIYNLTKGLFQNQKSLVIIDLVDNNLDDFGIDISHMDNLTYINFTTNYFKFLTPQDITMFKIQAAKLKKATGTQFKINLNDNELLCSCTTLDFAEFLVKEKDMLDDYNKTACDDDYGTLPKYKLPEFVEYLPKLQRKCQGRLWLISIIVVFVCVMIVFCVSIIAYRHRWDIKYLCLQLTLGHKHYQELQEQNTEYKYDAFVAFHRDEERWVEDDLLAAMEEGYQKLRICIHSRDFIAGMPIEENILRSIENSRKTVLVVSEGFVNSGWCRFEMYMARHYWIEKGVDRLIVVLKDRVPTSRMPRTLVGLLRTHTYLEWPKCSEGQTAFWLQLKRAISSNTKLNEWDL